MFLLADEKNDGFQDLNC